MTQSYTPRFLEEAFENGFSFIDDNRYYTFYIADIGNIKIIEGRIIACDPFLYNNDIPFNVAFPCGSFPVILSIAKIDDDERIAFARIKFSESKPVKWTIAICDGQDISDLKDNEIFGYGVDAGTGALMDTSGGKELMNFFLEQEDNYEVLIEDMKKTYKHTRSWLLWTRNNSNVAMFSSGWGDGFYATYIGYDNENTVCRLVTDFQVI